MQFMSYIVLASMAVSQAPGGKKTDDETLQGEWNMTSKDPRLTGGRTLRFTGDKFEIIKSDGQVEVKGTFKLDAKKMPKEIDLLVDKGERKITIMAIYDLNGGQLKLCGNRGEGARPSGFPANDSETMPSVSVFERKKSDKK